MATEIAEEVTADDENFIADFVPLEILLLLLVVVVQI